MKLGIEMETMASALLRGVLWAGICGLLVQPAAAAVIEGRVVDAEDGTPLADVQVNNTGAAGVQTDADGVFRFEALPAGDYFLYVDNAPTGYVGQIYNGSWCVSTGSYWGCPVDSGIPLSLDVDQVETGIEIALTRTVPIRGTIRAEENGAPLQAQAYGWWCVDALLGCLRVDSDGSDLDGRYQLEVPPTDALFVVAEADNYLSEAFDDILCDAPQACDPTVATPLDAGPKQPIEGIDFDLTGVATILGTVTGEGGPVNALTIWLFDEQGAYLDLAQTNADGEYTFGNLSAGAYFLRTFSSYWADELYGGLYCPQTDGICDVTRGTPVEVEAASSVADIDFDLEVGGTITGRVTAALSGEPIASASVIAHAADGQILSATTLSEEGVYSLSGLAPGEYRVSVREANNYLPQLYNGITCGFFQHSDCPIPLGDPVAVQLGQTVEGIDFALFRYAQCQPSDTFLCLNEGRFAVELNWFDQDGVSNRARAEALDFADDTGYFWFFQQENVEVTVKVLDACHTQSSKFWVFAAGLTNLRTQLNVTDMFTGETQTYYSDAGAPFTPVLDTRAFDSCQVQSRSPQETPPAESVIAANPSGKPWLLPTSTLSPRSGACQPGNGVLCLGDGRFQIEAAWEKPNGLRGMATAVPLTDESGFFWFFQQDNVELMLKVLDNCGGNTDRFWVFTAGLTNLGVKLRVTDTETGEVWSYDNPVSQPFQPRLDTRAFSTCP